MTYLYQLLFVPAATVAAFAMFVVAHSAMHLTLSPRRWEHLATAACYAVISVTCWHMAYRFARAESLLGTWP